MKIYFPVASVMVEIVEVVVAVAAAAEQEVVRQCFVMTVENGYS